LRLLAVLTLIVLASLVTEHLDLSSVLKDSTSSTITICFVNGYDLDVLNNPVSDISH